MGRKFSELDRDRCQHCGKWFPLCSLFTLDEDIEHYGCTSICKKCYDSKSKEYWIEWAKKRFKKS